MLTPDSKLSRLFARFARHPIDTFVGLIYGCYLTLRYVDDYDRFPAIAFGKVIKLKIIKGESARLVIKNRLSVVPWLGGKAPSCIHIADHAKLRFDGAFSIGDDVRISLAPKAEIIIGGRSVSSGSGITCKSVVLAHRKIVIGEDCLIAWDTFITDCDGHAIAGCTPQADTCIGDRVWIASGAKCLKGAIIGNDSIVASSAVVLAGNYPAHSLLAGTPAKTKAHISSWSRDI